MTCFHAHNFNKIMRPYFFFIFCSDLDVEFLWEAQKLIDNDLLYGKNKCLSMTMMNNMHLLLSHDLFYLFK